MKLNQQEKIDIILPSRLGDCIISLSAIVCLKQLNQLHNNKYNIRLVSTNALTRVIESLDLFEIIDLNLQNKIFSWIKPADKVITLLTSSKTLGYKAKESYGHNISNKAVKFDVHMPYLNVENTKEHINSELFDYLFIEKNISTVGISFFGICLELGFTPEEIIKNFYFDQNSLEFRKNIIDWDSGLKADNYYVFCMEAAYGSKNDNDRRWNESNYFEISQRLYKEYNIESAFIGINNSIKLPDKPYMHDFRKKLSLEKTCMLFKHSRGYIGNDTGPLHIANLMKKPSVGVYFRKASLIDYTPIFKSLNNPVFSPQNIDEVYSYIKTLV